MRDASLVRAPVQLVVSESAIENWEPDPQLDVDTIYVPDRLFADVSSTRTPQGVIGVFPMPTLDPLRPAPLLTVVADGIQDPGNLGTMIRSAAAHGASQLLCTPGTVDLYNPKVVRAAAGVHFLLPVRMTDDVGADLDGSAIYVAECDADTTIDAVDWTAPSSVLIGSEARGPSELARSLSATPIKIPMLSSIESLNAGVSASIILYEAFRQRRRQC